MNVVQISEELASSLLSTLEATQLELKRVQQQGTGREPMSKTQAAKYLGVARSTLDEYINQGAIAVSRFGGRVWVTRGDIDKFIDAHKRAA